MTAVYGLPKNSISHIQHLRNHCSDIYLKISYPMISTRFCAFLYFILYTTTVGLALSFSVSPKCNLESDYSKLGQCLRPWLDAWEAVRVKDASNIILPMLVYPEDSVMLLCERYMKSRDHCFTAHILKRCHKNKLLFFVRTQMEYFCNPVTFTATEDLKCSRRFLMSNGTCLSHIKGFPYSADQNGICKAVQYFMKCIRNELEKKCGKTSIKVIDRVYQDVGCENGVEQETEDFIKHTNGKPILAGTKTLLLGNSKTKIIDDDDENFTKPDRINDIMTFNDEITRCYSPMITKLDDLYDKCSIATPFTMFFCHESELTNLCDEFRITLEKCLSHDRLENFKRNKIVEFMDEQLGILCANIMDKGLSKGYSCLRKIVSSKMKCFRTVKNSYHYEENKCDKMKEFHECIEPDLKLYCDGDAQVLFSNIFRYRGCSIDKSLYKWPKLHHVMVNEEKKQAKERAGNDNLTISSIPKPALDETRIENKQEKQSASSSQKTIYATKNLAKFRNLKTNLLPEDPFPGENDELISENDKRAYNTQNDFSKTKTVITPLHEANAPKDILEQKLSLSESSSKKAKMYTIETVVLPEDFSPGAENSNKVLRNKSNIEKIIEGVVNDVAFKTSEKEKAGEILLPFINKNRQSSSTVKSNPITKQTSIAEDVDASEITNANRKGEQQLMVTNMAEVESFKADIDTDEYEKFPSLYPVQNSLDNDAKSDEKKKNSNALDAMLVTSTTEEFTKKPIWNPTRNVKGIDATANGTPATCIQNSGIVERCLIPLRKMWQHIKDRNITTAQSFFPFYQYTRNSILELCDEHASAIRCVGPGTSRICKNNWTIYFADRHFGYICDPRNIRRFLHHQNCILKLESNNSKECQQFIMSKRQLNEQEKCDRMQLYYRCLEIQMTDTCGEAAADEFRAASLQYGCKIESSL